MNSYSNFSYQIYLVSVYTRYLALVFVRGKKTNTCQRALLCQQPSWQSQHRHNCHNHHNHSWHHFWPSLKIVTVIILFNIIAVIIIIIEMDETLVPKAHWAEDTRNLHNWCIEIYYILSYKNKENSPPSNIYLKKNTLFFSYLKSVFLILQGLCLRYGHLYFYHF